MLWFIQGPRRFPLNIEFLPRLARVTHVPTRLLVHADQAPHPARKRLILALLFGLAVECLSFQFGQVGSAPNQAGKEVEDRQSQKDDQSPAYDLMSIEPA